MIIRYEQREPLGSLINSDGDAHIPPLPARQVYIEYDHTVVERLFLAIRPMYYNDWDKAQCSLSVGRRVYYSMMSRCIQLEQYGDWDTVVFADPRYARGKTLTFDGIPMYIDPMKWNEIQLLTGPDAL